MKGLLYVVATPIGNLDDMTYRAVSTLSAVALIAAEDTRHSQHLLTHYGIKTPCVSLHEHNERSRVERIARVLQEGKDVALISDAGTPLISDPGYRLVQSIIAQGFCVKVIPGPCAAIAALSIAGVDSSRFCFEGFLVATAVARRKQLQNLLYEERTLIFYESPHRIIAMLEDVATVFGATREIVVARELTKTFETVLRGPVTTVLENMREDIHQQKGEFVVLIAGYEKADDIDADSLRILNILAAELPPKQACALTASITGLKKNKLYSYLC